MYIAYVGPFLFPWGQPCSRRVCGIARSLAEAGYDILIGSGGFGPSNPAYLSEGEFPGSIKYVGLNELPPSSTPVFSKSRQIFFEWGKRTIEWLDSMPEKPSFVIVYGGDSQYLFRLFPWCRRNNIPIIVDVVEWYDSSHVKGGFLSPFNISAKVALRYYYPKCNGIIAISSFLTEYYRKRGCKVICVPPTSDVGRVYLSYQNIDVSSDVLTLVYAGTPGKKDLLGNVIKGIARIDPFGRNTKLLVIGPSLAQVKHILKGSEIPHFVEVLGRIEQMDVAIQLQKADFSVLLREPLHFAQAGFPTKFVESMANGTPVIANLTSDLGSYLHDGANGLVCEDHLSDSFANALGRALKLTAEKKVQMKKEARLEAERSFDFRNYTQVLKSFLKVVAC